MTASIESDGMSSILSNDTSESSHGIDKSDFEDEAGTAPKTASARESSSEGGAGIVAFGRQATKAVNRSKCLVYLVLALAAVGFGTAVMLMLTKAENDDFETQVRLSVRMCGCVHVHLHVSCRVELSV